MLEIKYVNTLKALIDEVLSSEATKIESLAHKIAASLVNGGVLHVFGSGHSAMIGKEVVHRAGGLMPINLIPDPTEGMAERVEGYGSILIQRYCEKYGFQEGEVLIVVSTSGRNPLPIEIALGAKAKGVFTSAITSVEFSRVFPSRHSSGKRLFEVVDLVIDNHVPVGDAVVEIPGIEQRVGPVSTIIGALIMNMIIVRTTEEILALGSMPPILLSQNLDGADAHNRALHHKYRHRLTFW